MPVGNGVAVDAVYGEAVGRAVAVEVGVPPCAADGTVDVLVHVLGVDVVAAVVRVAGHYMHLLELFEQVQDVLYVLRVGVYKRNMYAEDEELVLVDIRKILTQPFELFVGKGAVVGARRVGRLVLYVAHADYVRIAAVPRVVDRSEDEFELALECEVECRRLVVGRDGREVVVVVAHGLEYGHAAAVARAHGVAHGHHVGGGVARALGVYDVAQRDAVAGDVRRFDRLPDLRHGLVDEARVVGYVLRLGIGQTEEIEALLRSREAREGKVVSLDLVFERLVEARAAVVDGNFAVGGDRVEDVHGVAAALELVLAVLVGNGRCEAITDNNALHAVAVRVGDKAVDVVIRFDRSYHRRRRRALVVART